MNANSIVQDQEGSQRPEPPHFVSFGGNSADGWNPPASDRWEDQVLEEAFGGLYADIAVRHSRAIKNPDFINFIMAAIYYKATRGLIRMGGLERGFINRICRLAYAGSLS